MAYVNSAKETSTTTGTGDITLAGAATGFQTLNNSIPTNEFFKYVIELNAGSEWEVGEGRLSSATNLKRVLVLASSNANALVNFSAGTKNVWVDLPATDILAMQIAFYNRSVPQ